MLTLAIPFPPLDPVLIEIGPLAIRWYALAYIFGLVLGWRYLRRVVSRPGWRMTPLDVDDLLLYATLGVVLGGRLGYVLFYHPDYYLARPLEALAVWQGGMSFHGGTLGVIAACLLFAWRRGLPPLEVGDAVACAAPIGLGLGRIANFINGELYGRVTDVPWAVISRAAGPSRATRASSTRPSWRGWCCSWSSTSWRGARAWPRTTASWAACSSPATLSPACSPSCSASPTPTSGSSSAG